MLTGTGRDPSGFPAELLDAVLRLIGDPIFVKDRRHAWVWINDAFCALVGHPREALLGKTDHDFFPAEQADFFHRKDREVFDGREPVTIEEEPITDARGCVHILATTKAPLLSASGEVTHLVGVIHDISRLKSVEEDLRLANEGLERRVEERARELREAQTALLRKERLVALGQLSGGLAHQIRTPLAAINNAAAVLRQKLAGVGDADARRALEIISEEVWEANRIITDLLDFARVRPPSRARVGAVALIEGALAAARSAGSVSVICEVPADLDVVVDERQTRDALGNIIRNALEAMGERGTLTVRAAAAPPFARITIEDTGPGLSGEAAQHLFEPLVTSKELGLGLGLTTAKALIENQGGQLRLASSKGPGARFEIRVPLAGDTSEWAPRA